MLWVLFFLLLPMLLFSGIGGYTRAMKILGHLWAVVKNIVILTVILAIFGQASQPFERLVFALLVMIYLEIVSRMAGWSRFMSGLTMGLTEEFKRLREVLPGEHDEKFHVGAEWLEDKETVIRNREIRFWINSAFYSLFWVIALYNLLIAVW